MAIYRFDLLDKDKHVLNTGVRGEKEIEVLDTENVFIVLCDIQEWYAPDHYERIIEILERNLGKKVLLINFPDAKAIEFARLTKIDLSPHDKDSKSLYSRKLRIGRKRATKSEDEPTKEEDAAESTQEEKVQEVQEEEATPRDEENPVRGIWTF
jgi:hypothetical protein